MKVNEFLNEVLAAAKAAGIDPAEVYYHGGDSFNVSALDGEISDYKVASSCGVSLRGMFGGKMGSASTEAFDADAVRQLIDGVKESATLLETDEQDEIFAGEERYPTIEKEESDVATTSAEAKIEKCLKLEALAKAADPRIRAATFSPTPAWLRRAARPPRSMARWLCPVALTALTRRKLLRMRRKKRCPS